jgi:hypothetical protein
MKRITIKQYRLDVDNISFYHPTVSILPGGGALPSYTYYYVEITMKKGDKASISCRDEEEQEKVLKDLDDNIQQQ